MNSDKLPRYSMRISSDLLNRLHYIARYEGRTTNKQLEQMVKQHIKEFENQHGAITDEMLHDNFIIK